MIETVMTIAWIVAGLICFRRVGYWLESGARDGHEFQNICNSCRCNNCKEIWGRHHEYRILSTTNCDNFEFKLNTMPHFRTMAALPVTLAVWPLFAIVYFIRQAGSFLGFKFVGQFFVPAPQMLTKSQKESNRIAQADIDAIKREVAITQREKELGIGQH